MEIKRYLVLLIVASLLFATRAEDDDEDEDEDEDVENGGGNSVLVLTTENFDDTIAAHDTVLVEFYAPWCGHCKQLEPEYAAAAEQLSQHTPPVVLAKVDATQESELGERFDVSGYPTLKFFKGGVVNEYEGPREKEGIVKYMKERASPDWKPPAEAVVTVTTDTFQEFIDSADLVLLEFYAPWCGHCKKLAPDYEKAAKRLADIDEPIFLGKVDATEEKELASRFDVTGYPTLKMFRNGRDSDYNGERDVSGIINYMMKQQGEASKLKHTKKEVKHYMLEDQVTIMGFFDNMFDPLLRVYMDAANDLREDFTFGHSVSKDVGNSYKVNPKSVVVFTPEKFYTKYEPKWHIFNMVDGTTPEDVQKFIQEHQHPLVGQYTAEREKHFKNRRPLCLVFYAVDWSFDHREATQLWRNRVAGVAASNKEILFAVADEDDNKRLISEFRLEDSGEELNIGCYDSKNRRYKLDDMDEWDDDDVEEFLGKFRTGKLPQIIKSQKVPKKQSGPVVTVVGNSFKDIVMDPTKDVLIELYAPWCGHCKSLTPKYNELAKRFKNEKNLVIAKMDATANEAPEAYRVGGFPTIYWAPANNKENPIQYDRQRETDDFEKFIKEKATVSFGKGLKEEL
ncbi:protein disulfide-isomerase A4-like [Mizuhopecten yessoensis]|uniref:Protein disulfide-isomerase n=1 Tax=Mizuhopecten yessoensis TaxID=6573 RepID=A0A210PWA6_MIZYE|nr:protein disulfide-isomerase A4-like [Mizuhopecten yessoensis]OWF40778.1 Protein disulfide-isomerase A4 [Mizuhopecten yessoensis]